MITSQLLSVAEAPPDHKDLEAHYNFEQPLHSSLYKYTWTRGLNKKLYNHNGSINGFSNKDRRWIGKIATALRQHTTPKPLTIYSGVHLEHDLHKIGQEQNSSPTNPIRVIHHGFTSASLRPEIAQSYSQSKLDFDKKNDRYKLKSHSLRIHLPQNYPGAYIAHISAFPSEQEFLLPKGMKFHINPTPEISHNVRNATIHHIWDAHPVLDSETTASDNDYKKIQLGLSKANDDHFKQAHEFANKVWKTYNKHLGVYVKPAHAGSIYAHVYLRKKHPEGHIEKRPLHFKIRIADHAGNQNSDCNISLDPISTNTVDDAMNLLAHHVDPKNHPAPKVKLSQFEPETQEHKRAVATYNRNLAMMGKNPHSIISKWKTIRRD